MATIALRTTFARSLLQASGVPGSGARRAVAAMAQVLDELVDVLRGLDDEVYARHPIGPFHSSIGAHVRHSLDHLRALLDSLTTGELDYDRRLRGTSIERERLAAIRAIMSITASLDALAARELERPIVVISTISPADAPLELQSTVLRELLYVLSHTIHHNAIIAAQIRLLGFRELPAQFGYAPSTIAHRRRPPVNATASAAQERSCARSA